MSPDAFVVSDYINSPQAIRDVEAKVNLREIFTKPNVDFWSRLAPYTTPEVLDTYWLRMVFAHFDLISGNVSVAVQAFTPQDSLALANALIAAANAMFGRLNEQAQHDFVHLADENWNRAQQQLRSANEALLTFRNKTGMIDAGRTAVAGSDIIDGMRKQLEREQTQYASLQASSPQSPALPSLRAKMAALENQIRIQEQAHSSHVNVVTPELLDNYQSLTLNSQFAEKEYTNALGLRNQAYFLAQNHQSYIALFDSPTLAGKPMYPDRPRAIAVVVLAAGAAWFVGMLITYAIRDHLM
jgi:capsular polysaccharide transport system permease protein